MSDYENRYDENETFTNSAVVGAALRLLADDKYREEAIAHVSVEYERKGYTQRGPLNDASPYRGSSDDVIVTVELRLPYYTQKERSAEELLLAARAELTKRNDAAVKAAEDAKNAKIAALEAELAALRA